MLKFFVIFVQQIIKKKCSAAFILLFPFKLKGFILCKMFHNVVEHISVKAGLTQSSSLHEQSSQLFNTEDSVCMSEGH